MTLNARMLATLFSLYLLAAPGIASAVDGVIEINQASANAGGITSGDAPGLPAEIFSPGSYRLTGNLQDKAGASALVFISSGGVTLDLGGFELEGDGLTADGVSANTIDVTVRNGRVRGVAGLGINLGSRGRVEGVTVRDAAGGGIACGADCKLRDLVFSSTGSGAGYSIECGLRCEVLKSTLAFNGGAAAIQAGTGSRVEANLIENGNAKISVGANSIVARNTLSSVGARITVGANSMVISNTITDGSNPITATGPSVIRGNVIQNSSGTAIVVTGMATIESNSVDGASGGFGIACGPGSLVRGNTVRNASLFGLESGGFPPVGYAGNVFSENNGGNANAQVDAAATDLGGNLCGVPAACP